MFARSPRHQFSRCACFLNIQPGSKMTDPMSENVNIGEPRWKTTRELVSGLAELARVEISDEEVAALEKELPAILHFVEQVREAGGEPSKAPGEHRNVMREDSEPHESGLYTEELLAALPSRKDNFAKVEQVLYRQESQSTNESESTNGNE